MIFEKNSVAQIDLDLEVPYISFDPLAKIPFIKHGFSTKLGGVSKGIYSSMNLQPISSNCKDRHENIIENFERMARSIGFKAEGIVISDQTHKTKIRLVKESDSGKGLYKKRDYEDIDGLITNVPGLTLVTNYADCVPLYFVDINKKAIGLSHAGWRGTVGKIGYKTVEKMNKHFKSMPEDIIAVIGPSICQACYEVDQDVKLEFEKAFDEKWHSKIIKTNSNSKFQLDLWEANRIVLLEAGLKKNNIFISNVCTYCNSELLFSHRKTKGKRGSLAAFLSINEVGK